MIRIYVEGSQQAMFYEAEELSICRHCSMPCEVAIVKFKQGKPTHLLHYKQFKCYKEND